MKSIILLLFLVGTLGCVSSSKVEDGAEVTIGESLAAKRFSNIYFSGQPSSADYSKLKSDGFALVVNLRDPSEYDESREKDQWAQAGVRYVNVPFAVSAKLNDEFIEKVTKEVMKDRKAGNILIHCSSGNRAGIWAGGHFYKDHGYSKEKSIEISQKLGITSPGALNKLKAYLETK